MVNSVKANSVKIICNVYRCSKDGMYLYVSKADGLTKIPSDLQSMVGKTQLAMTLALYPEKKLAMGNAAAILASIEEKGFYLQMPPQSDSYMQTINRQNHKLY